MYSKVVPRFGVHRSVFLNYTFAKHFSNKSNEEFIVRSSLPDIQVPNLPLPEFLFQDWSTYPNREALECGVTGKKYTFEELRRKSINLSASFTKKLKLRKGDVVAILLPNIPDYAICILGALQAGLIVTTLSPLYTVEEVTRHLTQTNAQAVITLPLLTPLVQRCPTKIPIIAIKSKSTESLPQGTISFTELVDELQEAAKVVVDPDDVAIMPSSSGTTGMPKAVELTHRNIVTNVSQIKQPGIAEVLSSTGNHQAILPGILPFFHVAGLMPLLFSSLWSMCKIVTLPKFQPDTYTATLDKFRPHFLILVPYIVGFLTNNECVKKEYLERIQIVATSAAPMSAVDEERLILKAGEHIDILQAYGITEATGIVSLRETKTVSSIKNFGSVGKPVQNTLVKVVDETGKALGPNQPGELMVKGPQIMKGYYKNPKQTAEAFVDGWLKTGDIGYYNEHNIFYVTDRLKELIKVKGFQVAPAELEAIIREHPSVLEVAVIGIPHNTQGEVPKAYVVLKEKSTTTTEEIKRFVATRVAKYKQLEGGVAFVDGLPKAASGKIVRRKVKTDLEKLE